MDENERKEVQALVVGFLQQGLKERPNGYSIQEFERIFPERMDEPHDWYKRYKKKSALEALQCVPGEVTVSYNSRYNATFISLNTKSDKVDSHLIDLITNQRSKPSSRKSNLRRPSSKVLASFSLNRQYSGHYKKSNHFTRLNHEQHYRDESFSRRPSLPVPSLRLSSSNHANEQSSSSKAPPPNSSDSRVSSSDPRSRGAVMASMVPPKVRLTPSIPSSPSTSVLPSSLALSRQQKPSSVVTTPSKPQSQQSSKETENIPPAKLEEFNAAKFQFKQRIMRLLNVKFPEIKLMLLNSVYEMEYDRVIDPSDFGHRDLTSLLNDPIISQVVQINYKQYPTISPKSQCQANGKENCATAGQLNEELPTDGINGVELSSSKAKLDSIDPFNVRTMLQSLEPLGEVKEPPLKTREIDDGIKYKTFRIIFKSPDSILKLDDWEKRFEQESRLKIRIRDYGFRTYFEFFKHLAKEIPIKVQLNKEDEWIAVPDIKQLSRWLPEKISAGHYRAITAIEIGYEVVAFPDDMYTFTNPKDLTDVDYHPASIVSVKQSNSMWIQLRNPAMIEAHLRVEAAMPAYEYYREKQILKKVPKDFVKEGFPCAIYDDTQQRWCRALITSAPEPNDKNYEITALLVDYAIYKNYPISKLSCLMKAHLKLPVGPIYSRLSGIKDESEKNVSKKAKMTLNEYTCPPVTLACKFLKALASGLPPHMPKTCFEVELIDTRHGRDSKLADLINIPSDFEGDE